MTMMGKNKGVFGMFFLSVFMILLMSGLATATVTNATKVTGDHSLDIDFTNSVNITLYNGNQTARSNVSSAAIVYQTRNQTLLINATTFILSAGSNDSTRVHYNITINGGKNYYTNVTPGVVYAWNHTSQPTSFILLAGINSVGTFVDIAPPNVTFGINMTSVAIGTVNVQHRNTTGIAYPAFHNVTSNTSTNPQNVVYSLNNTYSDVLSINNTGAISIYDNISNVGWYSVNACGTLLETQTCQAWILNLSNYPFRGLSVNVSPTSNLNPGNTITCTSGGTDDNSDQIVTTFYSWFINSVESDNRLSTIVGGANQVIYCRSVLWDGNLNSSSADSVNVQVSGNTGGGGGGGGSPVSIPLVTSPVPTTPSVNSNIPSATGSVSVGVGPVSGALGELKNVPLLGDVLVILADIVDGIIASVTNAI